MEINIRCKCEWCEPWNSSAQTLEEWKKRNVYETFVDTSKVALERIMRAFVLTNSHFTSQHRIGNYPLGRGITLFLMVCVPEGKEKEFEEIAKCKLQKPAKVHTNSSNYDYPFDT